MTKDKVLNPPPRVRFSGVYFMSNSKKRKDSRLLAAGVFLLAILAVSAFSGTLTGLVVASDAPKSDHLEIKEDVNRDFTLNNIPTRLSTIRFCGNSGAFRFGNEWKSCIWLVTKNDPISTTEYNGYVLYQNSSGVWVNVTGGREYTNESSIRTTDLYVKWRLIPSGEQNRFNLEVTLPPYYYNTNESTRIEAIFALNKQANTPWARSSWGYKLLTIKVPETTNFNRNGNFGKWVLYYSYPNVAATDGYFAEAPQLSSGAYSFVTYEHGWPFCSPRGSCTNGGFGASGGVIDYAMNIR